MAIHRVGVLGILYYGSIFRRPPSAAALPAVAAVAPAATPVVPVATPSTLGKLLLFFLKVGSLTFGSGLVIVPFLQQSLVQRYGWLDERPVVITATLVGYLVGGFWGALVATVGIFLPSFLMVIDRGTDPAPPPLATRTYRASSRAPMPPRSERSWGPASC